MMTQMRTIQTKKGPVALPLLHIQIVPIKKVRANTYNPNHVSPDNMALLRESILANGFCFAVVTVYDPESDDYVIVDGFHRYLVFRDDLQATELPIIILEQDMARRIEATVQFNRARGVHQTELMGDLVQKLVEQGVGDGEIAQKLGMELEEVFRLKQITGIADLFKNQHYSSSWKMVEVIDDL